MTLYDEMVRIKKIQEDWGKLDFDNKYHAAFMSAYRVDINFEFYDDNYGWQRLCMIPTREMLGDIPAEIVKSGKNKFPERKKQIHSLEARRIRNWNELKAWYKWNNDWSKDQVVVSRVFYDYLFKGRYKVTDKEINEFLGGKQIKVDYHGQPRSRKCKKRMKMERRRYEKSKAD